MEFILTIIWMLGVTFFVDEMTMSFKAHHLEKISMTYKSEADVLQIDDVFHIGYTYQIFVCNDPV